MQFFRRVWFLLTWRRRDAELRDELAFHRDALERGARGRGADDQQATQEAQRALGSASLTRDRSRDVWTPPALQGLGHDVIYGFRTLRASPIAACGAILSLALGIGANTGIFSMLDSLVLRTLPVRAPTQLALVTDDDVSRAAPWTYAVWREIRDNATFFQDRAAWSFTRLNVGSTAEPQLVDSLWVSGSFFSMLGVEPVLGRGLSDADDRIGVGVDGPVAVISFAWWQTRFAGAADVVGHRIVLNDVPFTIVGVAPETFLGPEIGRTFAVAIPLGDEPLIHQHDSLLAATGTRFLTIVGRLHDGQSLASASAALLALQPRIRDTTRPQGAEVSAQSRAQYLSKPFILRSAASGTSPLRGSYQEPLAIVQGIVGLILLIACVNITNLMLARASARRSELSIRVALGASGWRIARQLLIESSLLAGAGAVVGMAMARWSSRFLMMQFSTTVDAVVLDIRPDARVWLFTAVVTIATTVLFGTLPAFHASRVVPMDAMRTRVGSLHRSSRRWMSYLLIAQVALSLTLIAGAAFFVRSFIALSTKPLGFEPTGVLVAMIDTTRVDGRQRLDLYERAVDAARALPSVADAGASYLPPVGAGAYTPTIRVGDRDIDGVSANIITPGWFATVQAHVIAGRDFSRGDAPGTPRIAIVNQAFATRMFGGGTPLGQTVTLYPNTSRAVGPLTIVGVVEDMAYRSVRAPSPPTWFVPLAQFDVPQFPLYSVALAVRARNQHQDRFSGDVVRAIVSTSPQLTVTLRPLPDYIRGLLTRDRVMALLGGFFGVLALLLASVGLYGLTTYTVSQQRAELGIRLALGATRQRVLQGVVLQTMWRVLCGVLLGVALSVYAWKLIAALLFGLAPRDPVTLAASAAAFLVVALCAAGIPAWRASRIDPAQVLRSE